MKREDCVCACGKMGYYSTQTHRAFDGILRSEAEVKKECEKGIHLKGYSVFAV